ncbi:hypothetical protein GO988_14235 [Hymenobacter sp. HMF4947]|uniref:Uncharacterized protein n=1 Tax=Hymenobacter ginkgonis TaxID=2682976 RepID=A0A7K1TGG8_9BACT|nr:hypothetical protein [Hymenobacter ginkgonis]MVN77490.1 hypothetical protein [Hymenobacter ginkgonis]
MKPPGPAYPRQFGARRYPVLGAQGQVVQLLSSVPGYGCRAGPGPPARKPGNAPGQSDGLPACYDVTEQIRPHQGRQRLKKDFETCVAAHTQQLEAAQAATARRQRLTIG